jgi:predicted DsbA family dithiol-disulfide isomerase
VSAAHRLALESPNISADMVDSSIYPHLVQKYNVVGVPLIIFNDTRAIEGVQPLDKMLSIIEELK